MKTPLRQCDIFTDGNRKEIRQKFYEPRLSACRHAPYGTDFKKYDTAVFVRARIDEEYGVFQKRIGFAEKLSFADVAEYRAVAPQIVVFDDDAARKHHAHRIDRVSRMEDNFAFFICALAYAQRGRRAYGFFFIHTVEDFQRTKHRRIHLRLLAPHSPIDSISSLIKLAVQSGKIGVVFTTSFRAPF